ncbi:glycosyltransferase [Ascidiimonas aurantiaca]|uniref:glycosyltransferase n=1 Tax=Ascidiimonas aurantiaca TaxID=1685432 RepID=UPI0030EB4FC1
MKVLQLIDSLQTGGAEKVAVYCANALLTQPVVPFLCTTRSEGPLKAEINAHVNYLFLKRRFVFDRRALIDLSAFIKHHKIDIIHAHGSSFFIASLIKIRYPKIKIVWHNHLGNSKNLPLKNRFLLKLASLGFSAVITVNKDITAWVKKSLYCKKVYYIPNFVILKNNASKNSTVLKGEEGKRMVCLSNLRDPKGHETLLKAFLEVSRSHPLWSLHLVGRDQQDLYSETLKSFITRNKLEKRVFLYGERADVSHILKQSTIGIISSLSEGLPLALLEYGISKLPVISTNVGDCDQVIIEEKTGLLVPPGEPAQLAAAIEKLIKNVHYRNQLAINLEKHVNENFNIKTYMTRLYSMYAAITN